MAIKTGAALPAILVLLAGCAEKELILPGERIDPRSALVAGAPGPEGEAPAPAPVVTTADGASYAAFPEGTVAGPKPVPVSLPGATANAEWTHRGGSATHRIANPALGGALDRVWTAGIGAGDSRKNRIAADPVVAGGRIFTLDADARVTATGTNGATVWQADLTPPSDRSGDASGGGLAAAGGRLYATTGFGELVALDAANGTVIWRQRFPVAVGGAPATDGSAVYVSARDGSGTAVRASDGKILWQVPGTPDASGVTGVSAPAIEGGQVIFPFSSGQLLAVNSDDGTVAWQAFVTGKRLGRAYAGVSDLTGDPVIAGGVVYAGSSAGRLAAVSLETGRRLWAADEGATSPVAIAGDAIWLISDENQLVRIDAATGGIVWRVDMPYFTKDKDKRRKAIHAHYGPVLAGGRLIVVSSDGYIRVFDPASGAVIGATELPGGAASGPAVAGGTLYVVSRSGQLHAFR